jgi:hypothetical protein
MKRIVYSSARIDDTHGRGFSQDFVDIQRVGVSNNMRNSVTGLLICTPTWFFQILEGASRAVSATMEKISTDRRHSNIKILEDKSISNYDFPDWGLKVFWRHQSIRNRINFLELGLSTSDQPMADELDRLFMLSTRMSVSTEQQIVFH